MNRIVEWLLPGIAMALVATVPARAEGLVLAQAATPESSVTLWRDGDPGTRLHLRGRVLGAGGKPIAGATLILRQADGSGSYTGRYQTSLETGPDGTFTLSTALPGQYYGAKHIHVVVSHPAYRSLDTRILFKGDPHIDEATEGDLAILLEETTTDGVTVLVGGVEFVLGAVDG